MTSTQQGEILRKYNGPRYYNETYVATGLSCHELNKVLKDMQDYKDNLEMEVDNIPSAYSLDRIHKEINNTIKGIENVKRAISDTSSCSIMGGRRRKSRRRKSRRRKSRRSRR
jgi:hypothetical protein